jgi:hypothetical protein
MVRIHVGRPDKHLLPLGRVITIVRCVGYATSPKHLASR